MIKKCGWIWSIDVSSIGGHSKSTFARDSGDVCFDWNSTSPPQFLCLWNLEKRNNNEY